MGNTNSITKLNFEDIQYIINENKSSSTNKSLLINTLSETNQECLIESTISIQNEIVLLNDMLSKNKKISIIIYGINSSDDNVYKKYKQLCDLGFTNVYVYSGGLFEWLLLQDIYGDDLFPTTKVCIDHLKYKGEKKFNFKIL